MSGVLATLQRRGDSDQALSRPAATSAASTGDVWTASRTLQEADNSNWQDLVYDEEFAPVVDALNQLRASRGQSRVLAPSWGKVPDAQSVQALRGGSAYGAAATLRPVGRDEAARLILAEVNRERAANPALFRNVETDLGKFMAPRLAKERERRDRARMTMERSSGIGGTLTGIAGSATKAMEDPLNIWTMPIGGGGKTLAVRLLTDVAANMGVQAWQTPQSARNRALLGEELTLNEALANIGYAGVGAAGFRLGGEGLAAGFRMAAPKVADAGRAVGGFVGDKAADFMPFDRQLARAIEGALPPEVRPPDVQAALNVINRADEIDDVSPYVRTYDAADRHVERLTSALDALEAVPAPTSQLRPAVRSPRTTGAASAFDSEGALRFILRLEGGDQLVTDSGGLTKYGISAKGNPGVDIANLTEAQALGIYRRKYLGALDLSGRSGEAALVALDASVNHGPGFARRILAAAGDDPARMIALRRAEYARLIAENPDKYGQYRNGWENRLQQVEQQIGLRAGEAGAADAPPPVLPAVRPDALDAVRPLVTTEGQPMPIATFRPDEIGVDAGLMQFKSGGDEFGVTERLQGVAEWDPLAAGMVTVWEASDGRRLIADGHQRLGLARRMQAAGQQDIQLNAFVLREADGFTARDARVLTALKNIGEGTGSATDAGKVFREAGVAVEQALERRLPPRSALVRDGKALARLSDDAFGAVVNEVIPESHGAAIGALAPDPASHFALVDLLHKTQPTTRLQAEAIVRQALDAGFSVEQQFDMFGSADVATALFAQKAKALDRALAELRKMKGVFQVAARNADTLETAGNRISVDASAAAAEGNARALALVERLALRKGNAVNELFNDAAKRLANGEPLNVVVRDLVRDVSQLDLDQLARGGDDGGALRDAGGPGGDPVGSGRGAIAGDEAGAAPGPASLDELEAAGQGGFALFDEPNHKAFDDPAGPGVQQVADSAWHDLRAEFAGRDAADPNLTAKARQELELRAATPLGAGMKGGQATGVAQDAAMPEGLFGGAEAPTFDLGDGKGARTFDAIDAEMSAEAGGIDAIRGCLL